MSEAKRKWASDIRKANPSPHGRAVGAPLADLADAQAAMHPEAPPRCKTCAFRHGTRANGYASTVIDALSIVLGIDESNFGCHHSLDDNAQPTTLCVGAFLCQNAPWDDVKAAVAQAKANLEMIAQGRVIAKAPSQTHAEIETKGTQ